MNGYILPSVLHSSEHFWVLNSNCGAWNFRVFCVVLHVASVHWVNALWSYWSNQHSFGTIFGSNRRTIDSVVDWCMIIDPFVIKKQDFARNIAFSLLKLVKCIDHNYLALNISKNKLNLYPATDPPRALIGSLAGVGLGLYKMRDYLPLTHLVKLLTGSNLMLSNCSSWAYVIILWITCSKTVDPHILGPYESVIYASLS